MKIKLIALLSGVLSLGAVGAACAADMAVKARPAPVAVYKWTGCYIGVNGGAGRAHKENIDNFILPPTLIGALDATGGVAGGQAGCDYQAGQFVVGARGMFDIGWLDGLHPTPNGRADYTTHIDAFATAMIRGGFLVAPSILLYVQGGGVWLRDRHEQLFPRPVVANAETQNRSTWIVGAGGEWMFAPNWSVFAEYNYAKFPDDRTCFVVGGCPGVGVGNPGGITQKLDFQTILVGINARY